MQKRVITVVVVALAVAVMVQRNGLFAKDAAPTSWKALERAYAEANVELAEARLAQAKSQNNGVAGSVSEETVDQLTADVKLTKDRLKQIQSGSTGDVYGPQVAAAAEDLRGLEADYAEAVKANKIQAGAVSEAEIRREQAEIAVAKARLAAMKAVGQQSPEVRMQWQISQLQDQIRALWARPLIED
jgi:hypothetical protein